MTKSELLDSINQIWEKNSHMRFGEFLATAMNYTVLYYIEDTDLINLLTAKYNVHPEAEKSTTITEIEKSETKAEITAKISRPRVYIHKGKDVKSIYKDELENYTSKGWKTGRKDSKTK